MTARLIRLPEVLDRTGLGKSAIYERIRLREFPSPVKLGRSSVFVEGEIQEWINAQIAARDQGVVLTDGTAARGDRDTGP
ncbi:MAG: helix-turn-helix transcriptional regulator [Gammaproteobacteria bacterium]